MDLRFTPEEEAFRADVRTFFLTYVPERLRRKVIDELHLSREEVVESQRILNAAGYAVPHWPVAWGGRDWSPTMRAILTEEIERNGVPSPLPFNVSLVGPVIAAFGSEEQKRRFLPAIANLDLWFCQGFSEPNAGSDLASLSTRAVREDDHYRVNGQKLWTTYAHRADWMFALVRTDPDARKQAGISFLLIDMKTPGVTVRPVRTIDDLHEVNEVFLDDVIVPAKNLVGEENRGWDYAKYLLGNERVAIARVGVSLRRLDRLKRVAREIPAGEGVVWDDPAIRRDVIKAEVALRALEITQHRVVSSLGTPSQGLDPKTAILKIKGSELQQRFTELLLDLAGPAAIGAGGGEDWQGAIAPAYFGARRTTIFGGSNEIQRNILAKAVLGL